MLKLIPKCDVFFVSYFQKVSAHTSVENLPRITLPHRIVQKLDKEKLKNLIKKHKKPHVLKTKENLVITCKRKEYHHYKNQSYPDFSTKDLASHGWKHRKSRGDHFTIKPFQGNPALECDMDSFRDFKLHEDLLQALHHLNITKPTNIQSLVIGRLLGGKNVLYAAETGNGKTLAYLLPIIQKVLSVRVLGGGVHGKDRLNKPMAVIIAPSRELVKQIYDVVRSLVEELGISVDMKVGGHGTKRVLREMQVKPMDILVASPGILSKLLSNRLYDLRHLIFTVFDEADTLFDDSFCPLCIQVVKKMKIAVEKPLALEEVASGEEGGMVGKRRRGDERRERGEDDSLQVVICGATMPLGLQKKLSEIIDMEAMEVVTTRHLHHASPHISHKFIRLGASQKLDHLLQLLRHNEAQGIKSIVFCNKPSTIYFLLHSLQQHRLSITSLHSRLPVEVREGRFESFKKASFNAIICTDVASRGLDTVEAQQVINYDFPNFMSDYVHRVGRVGRVGGVEGGGVVNFITHVWDVDLVWKIEGAVRLKSQLPNVNANIKRKLVALAAVKKEQSSLL